MSTEELLAGATLSWQTGAACAWVCVRERGRGRERQRERERGRDRERERKREREGLCEWTEVCACKREALMKCHSVCVLVKPSYDSHALYLPLTLSIPPSRCFAHTHLPPSLPFPPPTVSQSVPLSFSPFALLPSLALCQFSWQQALL